MDPRAARTRSSSLMQRASSSFAAAAAAAAGSRRGSTSPGSEGSSGSGSEEGRGSAKDGSLKDERGLEPASVAVLHGAIGGSFGPFPPSSSFTTSSALPSAFSHQDSLLSSSSDSAIPLSLPYHPSSNSLSSLTAPGRDSPAYSSYGVEKGLLWDEENAEEDDFLHNPDRAVDGMMDKQRAWEWWPVVNTAVLGVVVLVLVGLFAGWPIYQYAILPSLTSDASLSYLNGSSQIPSIPNMPSLIDEDTPEEARTRTGFDGEEYKLVFSDEFNQDGRTFWPGDDMYWEGVDLNYWATKDLEWYDPDAITTENGSLVITMDESPTHGLNFSFTGGYIEVSLSLPGTPTAQGYWPGVWTMGNLGRAGYGSSVDGLWPYSYDSCDVGTLPNQTWANGTGPDAALHSGSADYGGELSWLIGQRLSACTCPGEDHPGPTTSVGRGAPEIDILEGQIAPNGKQGSASQSIQVAPFDAGYNWGNSTPDTRVWDESITTQNQWHGEVTQESMSLNTLTDDTSFEGAGYTTYGYEYDPGPDGRITWAINGSETWELNASAMGPDEEAGIGQRLVSEEPMYITLNLAISKSFQEPQWGKLEFPGKLRIDYVRVFQKGTPNLSCDPPDHPTSQYIEDHLELYQNPNITVFRDSGYDVPKNSMGEGGCG